MDRLKVLAALSLLTDATSKQIKASLSALEAKSALREELNKGEETNE